MKFSLSCKIAVLTLSLLLAATAFAGSDTHKASLQLLNSAQVNGKQLPAGDYQVKWEGDGPNVEVSIVQGKKVLATTQARMVDLEQKSHDDAAVVQTNADGSKSLSQIRFSGKKFALELGQEAAQAQMKAGDGSK